MTHATTREMAGASDPAPQAGAPKTAKTSRRTPILLQVVAMIGIGALCYAPAADWFATLGHNAEISGYVNEVESIPTAEREAQLAAARDYNALMPQGMIRDPYGPQAHDSENADLTADSAYHAYEQVLRVNDNGVMGELSYPELGIGLPIYHGTSESVISRGIGHLYGSSLPVGGASTHSLLTAHSGLVHASLFTQLPNAELGDTFTISVMGETHYYRVDSIETILPEQTETLRIVPGQDYVTLITCTPIGVNSHRLLVRGERVDAPEGAGQLAIAGDGRTAGIAWWAVGFLGGSAAVALLLFAPPRKRNPRHSQHHQQHVHEHNHEQERNA